ncbi:hypothetical protein, partial [Salmonella enterica]|uniref:hypothetical protein n=1 Tax=Salmonella enterica TaxID=28901 RepID=UPI001BB0C7C3
MTGSVGEKMMQEIMESMSHRGPDEGEDELLESFHLAHQNLSTIGVKQGKQTISYEDDTKWIVA